VEALGECAGGRDFTQKSYTSNYSRTAHLAGSCTSTVACTIFKVGGSKAL
jgi:hypothetical protein